MRIILFVVVVAVAAFGVVYCSAGRVAGPAIQIHQPGKLVGQDATLDVTVDAPAGSVKSIDITLEQQGRTVPLFSMAAPGQATVKQDTPERIHITRPVGRRAVPDLQAILRQLRRHDFDGWILAIFIVVKLAYEQWSGALPFSSALIVAIFLALADINALTETESYRREIHGMEDLAGYLGTVENGQSFGALEGD